MKPNMFELEKEIFELKETILRLRKEQARVLSEMIEAEDRLLTLEEERMYLAAGEEIPEEKRCACRGGCRGKNNPM